MINKVEYFKHNLNADDIKEINKVLNSIFLTTGPKVQQFENEFSTYLGVKHTIGVTSCTAALHLALIRCGVGPGDEVITTPMTFVATATAILQAGATPVFVDVNKKTGFIDPVDVEKKITKRTKAIMPVHLYGRMVDMIGFSRLAKKYNLSLIEDAAHCIEGIRDGIRPGQLSNAACFSFYPTKSITCGEGGCIACNSDEDAEWYRSARHHGISKNASQRYTKKYEHWDIDFLGWKYNMDDIQASLLINQLKRIDGFHNRRYHLELLYRELLKDIEGLNMMELPEGEETSAHHLFTIQVPKTLNRDEVMSELQSKGVGCAVNYRAIHVLTYFRKTFNYAPSDFPNAFEIGERTISLPLYPKLDEKDVEYVCSCLKSIFTRR